MGGCTCYFNAGIQQLFATPEFIDHIFTPLDGEDISQDQHWTGYAANGSFDSSYIEDDNNRKLACRKYLRALYCCLRDKTDQEGVPELKFKEKYVRRFHAFCRFNRIVENNFRMQDSPQFLDAS